MTSPGRRGRLADAATIQVARREITTRARSKPFLILTALVFSLIIGGAVVVRVLDPGGDRREVTIGLERGAELFRGPLAAGNDDFEVTVIDAADPVRALEADEIDVALDDQRLLWKGAVDRQLERYITEVVETVSLGDRAEALGLGAIELAELLTPVDLASESLDGEQESRDLRLAAATVGSVATFMLLQIWGAFMTMGVIEEKSSRVVEVLLSQLRPTTLLAGKVVGLGALALSQMLLLLVAITIALQILDQLSIPSEVWRAIPLVAVTFLAGLVFYLTLFAAVGATVSRQEDAQAAQLPAAAPLIVGYFLSISSIGSPDNLAVTVASFVPFTSPVVLPFRAAATDVPGWQIALSLFLLVVGTVVMLRLAARVYSFLLLRTGTRVTWAEVAKMVAGARH